MKKMKYFAIITAVVSTLSLASGEALLLLSGEDKCATGCEDVDQTLVCGFDQKGVQYKMFPSRCALDCDPVSFNETDIEYCIKDHNKVLTRKMYGESCPVFCPSHYRPVCGASKFRDYNYRTFNNGCYLDMLNCRGEEEMFGYTEVPLSYCQRHAMKNIFAEQIIISGVRNPGPYE